jgi:hypothetical protein
MTRSRWSWSSPGAADHRPQFRSRARAKDSLSKMARAGRRFLRVSCRAFWRDVFPPQSPLRDLRRVLGSQPARRRFVRRHASRPMQTSRRLARGRAGRVARARRLAAARTIARAAPLRERGIRDGSHATIRGCRSCGSVSKGTWGNSRAIAPRWSRRWGHRRRSHRDYASASRQIELPAAVQPGQCRRRLSIALGYGRCVGTRWRASGRTRISRSVAAVRHQRAPVLVTIADRARRDSAGLHPDASLDGGARHRQADGRCTTRRLFAHTQEVRGRSAASLMAGRPAGAHAVGDGDSISMPAPGARRA